MLAHLESKQADPAETNDAGPDLYSVETWLKNSEYRTAVEFNRIIWNIMGWNDPDDIAESERTSRIAIACGVVKISNVDPTIRHVDALHIIKTLMEKLKEQRQEKLH